MPRTIGGAALAGSGSAATRLRLSSRAGFAPLELPRRREHCAWSRALALGLALLAAACDDGRAAGRPPAASRVDAIRSAPTGPTTVEELCDVYHAADRAPPFALPPLAAPAEAPPATAGSWRWVNLWATWCKPCIEELPLLVRWGERLGMAVLFVSADEDAEALATFRRAHPEVPAGPRLADPAALPAWLVSLGLDAAAPIPVHLLVDPAGRVRCVRAGGLGEEHFPAVQTLLSR